MRYLIFLVLVVTLVACGQPRHDIECYYGPGYSYCDFNDYLLLDPDEVDAEIVRVQAILDTTTDPLVYEDAQARMRVLSSVLFGG